MTTRKTTPLVSIGSRPLTTCALIKFIVIECVLRPHVRHFLSVDPRIEEHKENERHNVLRDTLDRETVVAGAFEDGRSVAVREANGELSEVEPVRDGNVLALPEIDQRQRSVRPRKKVALEVLEW